jgi:hypothetical protein
MSKISLGRSEKTLRDVLTRWMENAHLIGWWYPTSGLFISQFRATLHDLADHRAYYLLHSKGELVLSTSPQIVLTREFSLPILLSYSIGAEGHLKHHQTITLAGNVLDVCVGPALWQIVVSIDTIHKPGSMKVFHPEEHPKSECFETFELYSDFCGPAKDDQAVDAAETDLRWEPTSLAMLLNGAASQCQRGDVILDAFSKDRTKSAFSNVGELLYGLENLRKKRGQAAVEAEEEEAGEGDCVPPEASALQ